jgi:hypothetical protein
LGLPGLINECFVQQKRTIVDLSWADFATAEFRTPIHASSISCENLGQNKISTPKEKSGHSRQSVQVQCFCGAFELFRTEWRFRRHVNVLPSR